MHQGGWQTTILFFTACFSPSVASITSAGRPDKDRQADGVLAQHSRVVCVYFKTNVCVCWTLASQQARSVGPEPGPGAEGSGLSPVQELRVLCSSQWCHV